MTKLLRFSLFFFMVFLIGVLFFIGIISYYSYELPKISNLTDYNPPVHSEILAKDGTVLARIGLEDRDVVQIKDLPKVVLDAFLSAEDDNFFNHTGVDYYGIVRAFLVNLKSGKVIQGGSTITQQVAKTFLLSRERSYARKIKDILLAREIEKKFSKEEILFLYLNQVYLGGGYYGVKAAFKGYYDKDIKEATIAESAMIAGLLVAPGKYSPYVNPAFAKARQKYVLHRMFQNGRITKEEYDLALHEDLQFRLRKNNEFKAPYFTDLVRQKMINLVGEEEFLTQGFKVVTSLDWNLQQVAEEAVLSGIKDIDKRQGFIGPVSHITTSIEVENFEKNFRLKLAEEKSNFFRIDENFQKVFEVDSLDNFHLLLREEKRKWSETSPYSNFMPGILSQDTLVKHIEKDTSYLAIVSKVDSKFQIVYVSIGGIPGIIPLSGYSWAKERDIKADSANFKQIDNPQKILKSGDVIFVEVIDLSTPLYVHLNKEGKDFYNKNIKNEAFKKQRYLLCNLDQIPEVQGSLVAVLPNSGEVIAMVGGTDFIKSKFNRAVQALRQPGSSFKPILFASALENGYTPTTIIIDSPESMVGGDGKMQWRPSNYDGLFKGPVTFRTSLEQSRNIPTIKIADKIGIPKILSFVDRLGLLAKPEENLSLALGSFGVTLTDLVTTYAVFPNGGRIVDAITITSIESSKGVVYRIDEREKFNRAKTRSLQDNNTSQVEIDESENNEETTSKDMNDYQLAVGGEQVYDPRLAYLMTNLLRGVVLNGTGASAKEISYFLGGKTGTTNDYVDAWFIGFSQNVVAGVWTGFDNNRTMGWGETGAKAALPIWKKFMKASIDKFGDNDFKIPAGIIHVPIEKESGKVVKDQKDAFMEAFVDGMPIEHNVENIQRIEINKDNPSGNLYKEDDYYNSQQ